MRPRWQGIGLAAVVAGVVTVGVAAGSGASTPGAPQPSQANAVAAALATLTPDERAEYDFEASIIGPAHALTHAQSRQVVEPPVGGGATPTGTFDPCKPRGAAGTYDLTRPLPPANSPTGQARCGTLPKQPTSASGLARDGRWSKDVVDLPHYAIHAALLPKTGRVLFYGFEWTQRLITRAQSNHQLTSSEASVWDPKKGVKASSIVSVPAPLIDVDGDGVAERVPLYCSGQSFLPDGRVLVTGGTLDLNWAAKGYTQPPGLKITLIFDPKTQTWSRAPNMTQARWYPTQVKLADGRTIVMSGFQDDKPTTLASAVDVVSADGRTITHASSADRFTWTYPGLMLMPDSRVLLAGPLDSDVGLLDPASMTWAKIPNLPEIRGGENLVPVPTKVGVSPEAEIIGGANFSLQGKGNDIPAYTKTRVFNIHNPGAGWKSGAPQNRPRNWPNTVLLPDGSMVTLGGGTMIGVRDISYASLPANRRVELWDPKTKKWRLGPAQREDRTYHSVALLLPDGRVWSAGDDANPNRDGDTAEFYEPPYLFKGTRPTISAGPSSVSVKKNFKLTVTGAVPDRITMLAPSAVTHARDMNQRFVELHVVSRKRSGSKTTVTVRGPRSLAAAPPGPWMLFALSAKGAASKARWTTVK